MADNKSISKFYRILIILNIALATSLLLACLCCFNNPQTMWWISFFGLAYFYLLAANICFVVFWAVSRKKMYVVISTIAVLIGCLFWERNVQMFEKKFTEENLSGSFKILSFNVQEFEQMENQQPGGELLSIFDFFCNEDPDIICLQEFFVDEWDEEFNETNIRQQLDQMPYCHMELPKRNESGVVTFSKFPIIRKELVHAEEDIINACICSDLLIGADTVRVYNVHLESIGFQKRETRLLNNVVKIRYGWSDIRAVLSIIWHLKTAFVERAKQVDILTSHIEQSPYPVIICGDFNDPPTSYSYQKVRKNRKDAFIEAGYGRSATFNVGYIASFRIDYIIYSDIFKAYDYKSPHVHLSDHFPVMCRFVSFSHENFDCRR